MLTARGDVELLDAVEENQSWDEVDVPATPDDVAFTTGDWLKLLKPMGGPSGRSPKRWKRLAAMVATISGTALAIVTFSFGQPAADYAVNLETSARLGEQAGPDGTAQGSSGEEATALTLTSKGGIPIDLLSSDEAQFLGLDGESGADTTTTTTATSTTAGWTEQVLPPESEWTDAGNGVAVPDVLLRIRFCESTNNYRAAHTVSSARGAYQFLSKSWEWYGHAARYGVASADLATPAQQDEAAVLTIKRDGTRPWLASWGCWGSDSISPNYATVKPRTQPQPTTTTTTQADSSSSSSTETTADGSTSSSETTGSTSTTEASSTSTETTATSSTSEPTSSSSTTDTTGSTTASSST